MLDLISSTFVSSEHLHLSFSRRSSILHSSLEALGGRTMVLKKNRSRQGKMRRISSRRPGDVEFRMKASTSARSALSSRLLSYPVPAAGPSGSMSPPRPNRNPKARRASYEEWLSYKSMKNLRAGSWSGSEAAELNRDQKSRTGRLVGRRSRFLWEPARHP